MLLWCRGESMGKEKTDRQYYVVKANDLIRKTRYDLTTQQQKIVLFCISKIKPHDDPEKWYELQIKDICNACNLDYESGSYYYKSIKDDLQKLTTRLWVEMPDKSLSTVSWISDAQIVPLSGKIYIKFHPKMTPYLFDLRERYTQYHLEDVLVFKSRYSIRLYEILRSYMTQSEIDNGVEKEIILSLYELRSMLAVEGYKTFKDFNRYVLNRAVSEINNYNAELHISYDTYASHGGRKIDKIIFIVSMPKALEALHAVQNKKKRLNNKAPL